jgi:hypothetical protein
MTTAFVLGNGTSRQQVNPNDLIELGIVYACNAAYRDFNPHYLIAVDPKMIAELDKKQVQHQISVWTNYNKTFKNFEKFNYFEKSKGWSSGPTALDMAASHGHSEIYILGFDYKGIDGKFNNVYADTFNYKKSSDKEIFYGNWLSQTETVIRNYNTTNFVMVTGDNCIDLSKFFKFENFSTLSYYEFIKNKVKTCAF